MSDFTAVLLIVATLEGLKPIYVPKDEGFSFSISENHMGMTIKIFC